MSDGSVVDPRDNDHMRIAYEHMLQLMGGIGVSTEDSLVNGDVYSKWVCPEEIPRIFMLATLGNFLTSPSDSRVWEGVSSSRKLPVIVIDRTGKLIISNSFAQTRSEINKENNGHTESVMSVAFSPDNRTLASGSEDKTVKLWDVSGNTFKLKDNGTLEGHSSSVESVAFSPDGETLASASDDNTIKLWDVSGETPKLKENGTLTGHSGMVSSVAFSPDGETLASASLDKTVKLWDVSGDTPKEKATLEGHSDSVNSVAFSPDGETLASGSRDKTVKLWDVSGDTPKEKATLEGHSGVVYSVAFSPNGKTLATASADKTVKLWDVSGDTPMGKGILWGHARDNPECICYNKYEGYERNPECPVTGHSGWVRSVAFSPDNTTLASGSDDNTVKLWDVSGDTPQLKRTLTEHSDLVMSVAFSSDGKILASASDDKTIKLWVASPTFHDIKRREMGILPTKRRKKCTNTQCMVCGRPMKT